MEWSGRAPYLTGDVSRFPREHLILYTHVRC
jgi:hypothetical protein